MALSHSVAHDIVVNDIVVHGIVVHGIVVHGILLRPYTLILENVAKIHK